MELTLLERLIEEDFGYERRGSRWGRAEVHSSLVVDAQNQVFFFNAKGLSGSTLDYLIKVRKMSYSVAKDFLRSHQEYTDAYIHLHTEGKEVVTYPPLANSFHEWGTIKRDYFLKRGLTDSTIDRFNLGFYNGWFTVPIYEDGLLKNIQLRRDEPSKKMYKYYKEVGISLFNSDILKMAKEVVITEGPIDAIAIIQNEGIPVISTDSGGNFLPQWLSKFTHITKIWIAFDNDSAGTNEAKRVAKLLGETRCKIYNFWDFDGEGYDPVDYYLQGNKHLWELLHEKAKYSFQLR